MKIKFYLPGRDATCKNRTFIQNMTIVPRVGDLIRMYVDGKIVVGAYRSLGIFQITDVLYENVGKNLTGRFDIICNIWEYEGHLKGQQ